MRIERELEDVRNPPVNVLLEEGKEREIEPRPLCIEFLLILGDSPVIDQGMIVQEESARNVESDEHVDAVMFVSSKDEEDTEAVAEPGECVEEIDSSTRVLGDKEVQKGERDCVAGEHVVSTGPDTL